MNKYRDNGIFELCPRIKGKSLLYVGISNLQGNKFASYQNWFYDLFKSKGFSEFTILEIWQPNVDFAKKWFKVQNIPMKVVEGDVIRAPAYFKEKEFDVAVWWHGPEHVREVEVALHQVERVTKSFIVIGCPNGWRNHGASQGNPHEVHMSKVDEEFFKEIGYLTKVIPRPIIGHLTAIKEL